MFKDDTLSGKSILVTGGGSGLGLSMARTFASLGANIAVCGRSEEKLASAAEQLQAYGTEVATHQVDVRDYEQVGRMVDALVERFGALDGLVNNAAGNFLSASEDLSPNAFRSVVDIVLHGSFNCTHHLGRHLIETGRSGSILNIVTTYTETGSAFVLPSACSKAGVQAMTTSLAYEWAHYGIRVNAIAPGAFPTEGAWSRLMPDEQAIERYREKIPAGRFGEHQELANLAAFIMSDLSPYMTGECVTIDGGERLQAGQFNFISELAPREELKSFFRSMKEKSRSGGSGGSGG